MKRNSLLFLSPDGDAAGSEGGGTAVVEAPASTAPAKEASAAEPALRPPGELFEEEMARQRGQEPAKKEEPVKEEDEPPAKEDPPKKEPVKPGSALEAALEAEVVDDTVPPVKSELDDLPETLPRDNRGEHWNKARGKISTLERLVAERDAKITEQTKRIEAAGQPAPELIAENETLKKALDEYKDAITALNVDYDPATRKKYVQGRQDLVEKAAHKTKAFGGADELIKQAMGEPEGRMRSDLLKRALGDLDDTEKARVMAFITDIEKLDDERAELQKDPQGAWAKLQAAENAVALKRKEEAENFKKTTFDRTMADLPKLHFLLRTVDPTIPGADEHNSFAEKAKTAAYRLLGPDAKPQELAEAVLKSQLADKYRDLYVEARKQIKIRDARIAESDGAEPGFRGGKQPPKSPIEAQLDKSPGQIYNETMDAQRENM